MATPTITSVPNETRHENTAELKRTRYQTTGKDFLILLFLTGAAFFVTGYHPGAEDAEIYVPGIKKILHPALYPFGDEFFQTHAHLTFFPNLVAACVRLTHLSLDAVLLLWHVASIFLLLWACWRLASKCFSVAYARWAGVALIAALLTIPIAGTRLYILDQYFNPRSISMLGVLWAISAGIEENWWLCGLWLAAIALIHPLMTVYGGFFVFILFLVKRKTLRRVETPVAVASLVFPGLVLHQPSPAYLQAWNDHTYYHLLRWEWYEWVGLFAPLALLAWFRSIARRQGKQDLTLLLNTLLIFQGICLGIELVVMMPRRFEIFSIYQPARSLQIVFTLMFLIGGCLLGEMVLRGRTWRWTLLFVPLSFGMFYAQLQVFPGTPHIEWPGAATQNPWLEAFAWIRINTPVDAIFAIDPDYMTLPGENYQGFRAIAERSRLADATKDWSAIVMFPALPLADECLSQVCAASPWKQFGLADFERLKRNYGVTWVVVDPARKPLFDCPFANSAVAVCKVN